MSSVAAAKTESNDNKPEQADALVAAGMTVTNACKTIGISKSRYYKWRNPHINYVFFYGSLRQGEEGYIELGLDKYLTFFAKDSIEGTLYDLGRYPGIKSPAPKARRPALTHGELYRIGDPAVLPILDAFERYVRGSKSLYLRKAVTTTQHKVRAWAYFLVGKVKEKRPIASGDWLQYRSGAQLG